MKQQRILDMLEHIDERYILEAAPALRARRSSGPRKAGRTLLIAAVIVSLFAALCAVAYAAARAGLPCLEIRSVSNKVGPRTAEEKDFPGALRQLGRILPALNLV